MEKEEPEKEEEEPEQDLQVLLEEERRKVDELTEKLQYLQAEFENYRKREERNRESFVTFCNQQLVEKLLPVLDSFEKALPSLRGKAAKGMKMIHEGLMKVLRDEGLEEIPAVGKKFDPYRHEVVGERSSEDCDAGTIIEEVQKGYMFKSKLLRASKVIVAKEGDEDG